MNRDSPGQSLEIRRRRLRFRCWHRGMKEADLLLGSFADRYLGSMTEAEIQQLERLMPVPDPDIVAWLSRTAEIPLKLDPNLAQRLESHSYRFDRS